MKCCKKYKKGGNVSLKMGKHKSRSGGLTAEGVRKYNRETGSNLHSLKKEVKQPKEESLSARGCLA